MDPLKLVNTWYNLVTKAFTEHTLGTAVISIAAIGILVVLQKGWMSRAQLDEILNPEILTRPSRATVTPVKREV